MRAFLPPLAYVILLGLFHACATERHPATRTDDTVDLYHGVEVPDPYRWLESVADPEVEEWVAAQNAHSKATLADYGLRDHFASRIQAIDLAITTRRVRRQAGCWVITVTRASRPVEFLIRESLTDEPRLLFAPGELYPDREESVQDVYLSPDRKLLAYTSSSGGRTSLTLRVHDLERGVDLEDVIEDTKWGHPQWTADSRSILYQQLRKPGHTQPDGIDRESVIRCHRVGSDPAEDPAVYEVNPQDLGAGATVEIPAPGRYAFISDFYDSGNSISVLDLGDPAEPDFSDELTVLTDGRRGTNRLVGLVGSTAFIMTTADAPMGRIVAVDVVDPSERRTVVPESTDLLERARVAGDRLCVGFFRDVISHMRIYDLQGEQVADVELPTKGSAFWFSGEPATPMMTFAFDSFSRPPTTYRLDTRNAQVEALVSERGDFPSAEVVTSQEFYVSRDGTRVPMFIVRRSGDGDEEGDGLKPTILYGYGAVGAVMGPIFSSEWYAWIEAGGTFALANIRGGGEYGEEWRRAGRLENRQNTHDDFIAAAEHLIESGYTTSDRLAVYGISNGGLLVGAVMTQRAELFAAAVPVAGVLDALRFPSFSAGPRWAKNMGDPAIAEQFKWLYAWSPLHRIKDGRSYPATLVTTASDDDVVHPSQSYKFAARLQAAQGCDRPVLLRVYASGAHGGGTAGQGWWTQAADRLAFMAHHTGLTSAGASGRASTEARTRSRTRR